MPTCLWGDPEKKKKVVETAQTKSKIQTPAKNPLPLGHEANSRGFVVNLLPCADRWSSSVWLFLVLGLGVVQPEEADKPQAASKLPMLMMLRQAGLISDSDMKQQVASTLLSKNAQNRDLKLGGDDLLQTVMLMNALNGGKGMRTIVYFSPFVLYANVLWLDKPKERGAVTSAILGGGDPLKSLLISSALTGSGTGTPTTNNLLPILLMSSIGKNDEPTRGGGSCMGKCGSAVPRQDCGCDIACRQNGDCCHDFDYVCFVSDVQAQPAIQVTKRAFHTSPSRMT